jgi:dihydrolipoamide dehydrogenase
LLHIARVINEVREVRDYGVDFSGHEIDLTKVQKWRDKIIAKLVLGLN